MYSEKYDFPKDKEKLLTDGFLKTFKYEIERVYENSVADNKYHGFYCYAMSTVGFYRALKTACEIHGIKEEVYDYVDDMEWYNSDTFDAYLVDLMLERGIIEEGEC